MSTGLHGGNGLCLIRVLSVARKMWSSVGEGLVEAVEGEEGALLAHGREGAELLQVVFWSCLSDFVDRFGLAPFAKERRASGRHQAAARLLPSLRYPSIVNL